ncbi:MAG TPA: tetratricopeptide repeat protein [Casimicrobiaceae bacterium]|nr:tetratricopeptide repeat protein [Casimicrobiaceae bacterium]
MTTFDPAEALALLKRASALVAAGDLAAARAACAALAGSDDGRIAARAHLVLATCDERTGDPQSAQRHVETALVRNPGDPLAHFSFAQIQEASGRAAAAIEGYERAIALQDNFAAAHHRLGILLGESGEVERARAAFERVVTIEPTNARAWSNLGHSLCTLGRTAEAGGAFQHAVLIRPDYELAVANLAVHWRDSGEVERAEQLLRSALSRPRDKPPLRALLVALAGLLRERGALDEAETHYQAAIAQMPGRSAGEWFNLGLVYAERDEPARARGAYLNASAADRTDLRGALASRLALPMIYDDVDHLERAREEYAAALRQLNDDADSLVAGLSAAQLLDGLRWTNFFLAYQGRDDRALQSSYGAFVARALSLRAPQFQAPIAVRPGSSERLRIGFASAFFHVGTAGRYFRSWITDLDRERFEVFVYHLFPGMDEVASEIHMRADCFREFGGSRARPSVVAPVIRDDALDVLVYPELGMDHASFALAALRLAPRQLCGWGHPTTSGLASIDGYISCGEMEPANASAQYTERLHMLPGIGTRYRGSGKPVQSTRAALGLPEAPTLFLCPQSLFKVHPDNDELFAAVLSANPDAVLVMFDGRHPKPTARFTRRIAAAFERHGISAERQLRVLAAVPHDTYLQINQACDAMLDTLYWSGGNTSLDAIFCGLPIVAFEGDLMRGRQSAAMLRMLEIPELVAADAQQYVAIATRLARDREWREYLAARIRAGQARLFDSAEPVAALAELLLAASAEAPYDRSESTPSLNSTAQPARVP